MTAPASYSHLVPLNAAGRMMADTSDSNVSPVGSHTQVTSLSSVASVTVPAGASAVYLCATTKNVRMTVDGATAPTAAKGFLLTAGDPMLRLPVKAGMVLKFIEAEASAVLDYQFAG